MGKIISQSLIGSQYYSVELVTDSFFIVGLYLIWI